MSCSSLRRAALLAALVLAGCGGGGGGGGATSTSSGSPSSGGASVTVTPSLGKVSHGNIGIRCMPTAASLGSGNTGTTGSVAVSLAGTCSGPVLFSLTWGSGGTYFDESLGSDVALPTTTLLRAMVPDLTGVTSVAITPLTEMAVQKALQDAGNTESNVTSLMASAANELVVDQLLGTSSTLDILSNPTMWDAATSMLGNLPADQYAYLLGSLASMGSGATPALSATSALAADLAADGTLSSSTLTQVADAQTGLAGYADPQLVASTVLPGGITGDVNIVANSQWTRTIHGSFDGASATTGLPAAVPGSDVPATSAAFELAAKAAASPSATLLDNVVYEFSNLQSVFLHTGTGDVGTEIVGALSGNVRVTGTIRSAPSNANAYDKTSRLNFSFHWVRIAGTATGGGSGGGTTFSGMVSRGAPIAGASVDFVDVNGSHASTTSGTDGAYQVDVSGLSAPFIVKVSGGTYDDDNNPGTAAGQNYDPFYSMSTSTTGGVLNVTSLTTLAVQTASRQSDPDALVNGWLSTYATQAGTLLGSGQSLITTNIGAIFTSVGIASTTNVFTVPWTSAGTQMNTVMRRVVCLPHASDVSFSISCKDGSSSLFFDLGGPTLYTLTISGTVNLTSPTVTIVPYSRPVVHDLAAPDVAAVKLLVANTFAVSQSAVTVTQSADTKAQKTFHVLFHMSGSGGGITGTGDFDLTYSYAAQ